MMSIGHSALGPPTQMTGGSALGGVSVSRSQTKLDALSEKLKMKSATKKVEELYKPYVSEAQRRWAHTESGKEALGGAAAVRHWDEATRGKDLPETVKSEDLESKPMPTNEKDPKDWETVLGERLNRFSQLVRSEIVKIKLQTLKDKINK